MLISGQAHGLARGVGRAEQRQHVLRAPRHHGDLGDVAAQPLGLGELGDQRAASGVDWKLWYDATSRISFARDAARSRAKSAASLPIS